MQRREFLRSSFSVLAAASIAPRIANAATPDSTRRILYILAQFSQATLKAMQTAVETIGDSSFNVLVLSFLQVSLSAGKLTLLYNGNEFPRLDPHVPALLAKLRSGFGARKRIMLSIGGWQQVATFAAIHSYGIAAFVRQLTDQVILPFGFDGIDLDLEPQTGGIDQWMAVHHEYAQTLVDLTNEYKRMHPTHLVTHAPLSAVAAELYVKPAPLPGVREGILAATHTNYGNNIDWLNVQFYEGGVVPGGNIAGYYCNSLATPLMNLCKQVGIMQPLQFLTPLFQPHAHQPLAFCQKAIADIDQRCAGQHTGNVNGAAIWEYRQIASSIRDWSVGLEAALHA